MIIAAALPAGPPPPTPGCHTEFAAFFGHGVSHSCSGPEASGPCVNCHRRMATATADGVRREGGGPRIGGLVSAAAPVKEEGGIHEKRQRRVGGSDSVARKSQRLHKTAGGGRHSSWGRCFFSIEPAHFVGAMVAGCGSRCRKGWPSQTRREGPRRSQQKRRADNRRHLFTSHPNLRQFGARLSPV